MKSHLIQAQKIISSIQTQTTKNQNETYHFVHDNIGSTLSSVPLFLKSLEPHVQDPHALKIFQQIHATIKDTLSTVTQLNAKLKAAHWIPKSRETLIADLKHEIEKFSNLYSIQVKTQFQWIDSSAKLTLKDMQNIFSIIETLLYHSISRLTSKSTIALTLTEGEKTLLWQDDGYFDHSAETLTQLKPMCATIDHFPTTANHPLNVHF